MSRSYIFKNSKGETEIMSLMDASKKLDDPEIRKRFDEICLNQKNKRMKKDGFEPGWQANINAYAGGRQEYNKLLKERGLVEIGYDYVPQESEGNYDYCRSDEFINNCIDNGVSLSDNEREAIKSGDFFKD
jgi:hypothetical protein